MQVNLLRCSSGAAHMLCALMLLLCAHTGRAQSCTANAGGNATVCGSTTTLTGAVSGTLGTLNSPLWTFVSGPATPTIVSPNSLTTNVTGMTADGAYTFRLTRNCSSGTAISDVVITAHPRPASFTAGPDITNVCATTGTTPLAGVIPPGFTGAWRSINIFSRARYSTTVSTNSQFSDTTSATPTFSLINKSDHEIDPAYYAILRITSDDGICSYEDTAIVSFIPNPHILFPANASVCANAGYNPTTYNFSLTSSSPGFSTAYTGSAGTVASGTTVTMNVISQPAGGNLSLGSIESRLVLLNGLTTSGAYTFTLTVSNACGTYTTPQYTYTIGNPVPYPVNFQPAGHGAPEQLVIYSFAGTGGEHHCNSMAGTITPETFYFDINALDSPSVYTTVTPSGVQPPGGYPTVVVSGAGTRNRVATVTPPAGGWSVGTYKFTVLASYASDMSCPDVRAYFIHVSDNARPKVSIPDVSVCYPGTGAISATIPLPAVYKGAVNNSYFQDFNGEYNFTVVSKPAGSGTPAYTATNLRSLTSTSTTISNLTTAGDYVFRVTSAGYNNSVGDFLGQEYACSGTSMVDTFTVHVENPVNANAGSDQTLNCANSITLLGNNPGAGTGLWTKIASPSGSNPMIANAGTPNTTVTGVSVTGTYTYSWATTSQHGGCSSSDTVSFVVSNVSPATPGTMVSNYTCASTTGSISVTSPVGAAYEYSINGTTWQSSPSFSGLASGIYTTSVRYTGSTCASGRADTVKAAVCGNVFNDANGNTIVNAGETFSALPVPLYVYLVNSSGIVIDSAHVAPDGTYTLQAPPSQAYTLNLSTQQYPLGADANTTPVSTTPPAGWIATGESVGGTGDGVPNGTLAVTVGTSNIPTANFGIEQPPVAVNDVSNNNAYGSAVTVNVTGNDTDPAPGTIDATRVSMVAPGTATNIVTDAQGDITSMTIPGEGIWAVNTGTGAMTFTPQPGFGGNPTPVQYTVRDNAGAISNAATVTVTYNAPVQVAGSIFHDINGNTVINSGESFTSLPAPLYVYLINSSGIVTDSAQVAPNGTYSLDAGPGRSYTIKLSTQQYAPGTNTSTISTTPPDGWINTGENGSNNTGSGDGTPDGILAVTVGATNMSNQNFGIEQPPTANVQSYTIGVPAAQSTQMLNGTGSTPGALAGSDPEDGIKGSGATFTITDTTALHGNQLLYNGAHVVPGVPITNYDPALLTVKYSGAGSTSLGFYYTVTDAAGAGSSAAFYSISWATPLPVVLVSFRAEKTENTARLTWITASEKNTSYFMVEKSKDGLSWQEAGRKAAAGQSTSEQHYELIDVRPFAGNNYYRLRMVDYDGGYSISDIRLLHFANDRPLTVKAVPNPTTATTQLSFLRPVTGNVELQLIDAVGRIVKRATIENGATSYLLDLGSQPAGLYHIKLTGNDTESFLKLIKK